jgi:tRNA(Ile)-lysidine synthase
VPLFSANNPDLTAALVRAWPPAQWADRRVVVAVSGGSDSVALLRLLAELRKATPGTGDLIAAHYDHGVRGAGSIADAQWVRRLAQGLGLAFEGGQSREAGPRSEQALRVERHAFLLETARRAGARFIATGHTLDDQAETVMFRVLRGTGVAGLRGIAPTRVAGEGVALVRPLLAVRRTDLRRRLEEIGQEWREDPTNVASDATRTWLRNEVLPGLNERMPGDVAIGLARLAERSREAHALVEGAARELLQRRLQAHAAGWGLRVARLSSLERLCLQESLRLAWREAGFPEQAMTSRHWSDLKGIALSAASAARDFPGAIHARCDGDTLWVARGASPPLS